MRKYRLSENPQKTAKAAAERDLRLRRRKRKKELIKLHDEVVATQNDANPETAFEFGFKSRRLQRGGKWVTLPKEYSFILKACQELIDNKCRFKRLLAWGGVGINNIQCRRNIARLLACLLANTDMISGRIGSPSESGMMPITWDTIGEDIALRFGVYMSPKAISKARGFLMRAGYLTCERIAVGVDGASEVRSAPAYKQFTEAFFTDLKVVRYPEIVKSILATRQRGEKKGLSFAWQAFRVLATKVRDIFNASKFNRDASMIEFMFESPANLSPH